jgi:hypothetical protein
MRAPGSLSMQCACVALIDDRKLRVEVIAPRLLCDGIDAS